MLPTALQSIPGILEQLPLSTAQGVYGWLMCISWMDKKWFSDPTCEWSTAIGSLSRESCSALVHGTLKNVLGQKPQT